MEAVDVKSILESVLFISSSPVKLQTLLEVLPESNRESIVEELRRIKEEYDVPSKGVELVEVAGGYQFRTKPRWAEWVARLKKAKTVKFSRSALETLAIVAYRQPVIRPKVDEIRGVDSGWVLRSLMEKGLIKIMGRKDLPGRPIIYGTSKAFLELFNLNSLDDLPNLKEIQPPPSMEEIRKPDDRVEVEHEHEVRIEGEAEPKGEVKDEGMDQTEGEIEPKGEMRRENRVATETEVTAESLGETKAEERAESDRGAGNEVAFVSEAESEDSSSHETPPAGNMED